jgi:hypothetical protein
MLLKNGNCEKVLNINSEKKVKVYKVKRRVLTMLMFNLRLV